MSAGQVPAFELIEGMALGIGGALLLTPGFVTDAIGFACLIPFTRKALVSALSKRVSVGSISGGAFTGDGSGSSSPFEKPKPKVDGDVIEGEYTRKE